MALHIDTGAATLTGRRARNEDAWGARPEHGLFIVADGMGGYEGGEVASALATETVAEFFDEHATDASITWPWGMDDGMTFMENMISVAVRLANRAIKDERDGRLAQMGSTIVVAALETDTITIGHLGDSRVYLLRDGALAQLTRDHSFINEMLDAGVDLAEAGARQYKNVITRALGFSGADDRPTVRHDPLEPGDVLLLSTDGLHDVLSEEELAAHMAGEDLEEACEELVQLAYDRGSSDNITALMIRARR